MTRSILVSAAGAAAVLGTAWGLAAPAGAATLEVQRSVERACDSSLVRAGSPGTDRASWTASGQGYATARLAGGDRGDWDLAAYRSEEIAGASTSFGSDERVDLWVEPGQRFVFQACRRGGGRQAVPLSISFQPARLDAAEPVSLAEVAIANPADVTELERMGIDVTHAVDDDSADVILYSRDERERLLDRGFGVTVVEPDLAATDATDRAREAVVARRGVASALPSGRTSYRQYVDYTNDLKDLVDDNPGLVRPVEIGNSLEGRPIQGVEIASDVEADDDGRPVYVNMGVHHAREWPAGELPMEFAIDLVDGFNASDPQIVAMLQDVRVIVIPIVNPDGFVASRSFGTSAADDNENATLAQALAGSGAYRRKNCRPATPAEELVNCAMRTSGVDLNRNYGAYWGGPGSSASPGTQTYRGTAPYSEPESQAVREFSSHIHPTVFISNHTYTTDGKWLRQPGFDGPFLPQDQFGALTPDEAAMRSLGDDMAKATGWTSERGYATLGDITGATEDWNYFSQGSYGYTPEARGLNFHANYQDSVIEEYLGDAQHSGEGTREAFLVAGEVAASLDEHSVIAGEAPPAATLRLHKEFETPIHPNQGQNASIDDVLDSTLEISAPGSYAWHVMPSGRPLSQGETWTMSCELPGEDPVSQELFVARGEIADVDWSAGCAAGGDPPGPMTCRGDVATIIGTPGNDRGARKLIGTPGRDVIKARGGNDRVIAAGGRDKVCGGSGDDKIEGNGGRDTLQGGRGMDICPGASRPEVASCRPTR